MRLFTRKTKWDRLKGAATAAIAGAGTRRLIKVTLGVVGGAVATTAASAVVSSVRQQDET
jgi:uncharacterized protein (DUF697 family)